MKVTIELDLDDPEHKQAVDVFLNWSDIYIALFELGHNFSKNFKHRDWTEEQWTVFNEVKDWLMETFEKPLQIVEE
jgi:hypothetical protein